MRTPAIRRAATGTIGADGTLSRVARRDRLGARHTARRSWSCRTPRSSRRARSTPTPSSSSSPPSAIPRARGLVVCCRTRLRAPRAEGAVAHRSARRPDRRRRRLGPAGRLPLSRDRPGRPDARRAARARTRIPPALVEGAALPRRDREGAPQRGPLVPPAARVRPRAPAPTASAPRCRSETLAHAATKRGSPAYLETQNEDNLAYYAQVRLRGGRRPPPRPRRPAAVDAAPRAPRRRGELSGAHAEVVEGPLAGGRPRRRRRDVAVRAFDDDPFFSLPLPGRSAQRHRSVGLLHRAVLSHLAPIAVTRTALLDGKRRGRRAVGPARAGGRTRRGPGPPGVRRAARVPARRRLARARRAGSCASVERRAPEASRSGTCSC